MGSQPRAEGVPVDYSQGPDFDVLELLLRSPFVHVEQERIESNENEAHPDAEQHECATSEVLGHLETAGVRALVPTEWPRFWFWLRSTEDE